MLTKKTILVINDEMIPSYTLNVLLESKNFNLDLIIPGINGFEICKSLRANSRFAKLPVVMMTAWDDEETYINCLKHGASDVLNKPFDHANYYTIIDHYLYKSPQKNNNYVRE